MIKWLKQTWHEFLWLPLQMKILFVGLVFLVLFSASIFFKHQKKSKVITIKDIEYEIQRIDSITVDSTGWLDSVARANGIKRKRL